jgi:hypothetical protein
MSVAECQCSSLDKGVVIPMGDQDEVFQTLARISERGSPWWWLSAYCCRVCGQSWLVAAEERINDVFIMGKIDVQAKEHILQKNIWPGKLERYVELLEIGKASGRRATYLDPINSSALVWTAADLAREEPGISVARLAILLDLDLTIADRISCKTVSEFPVSITFDVRPKPEIGFWSRLTGLLKR